MIGYDVETMTPAKSFSGIDLLQLRIFQIIFRRMGIPKEAKPHTPAGLRAVASKLREIAKEYEGWADKLEEGGMPNVMATNLLTLEKALKVTIPKHVGAVAEAHAEAVLAGGIAALTTPDLAAEQSRVAAANPAGQLAEQMKAGKEAAGKKKKGGGK
jgi:hypothetical protein